MHFFNSDCRERFWTFNTQEQYFHIYVLKKAKYIDDVDKMLFWHRNNSFNRNNTFWHSVARKLQYATLL